MFSSPYSPFFTSGLLSQQIADSDSSEVQLASAAGPRRGSLPGESTTTSNDSSAFYVTLQPRRDDKEYLSFLSLDLAESQSMRSASLKRKASSSANNTQAFRFPRIAEKPSTPPPVPRASTPLRSRFSRDSLRTIPSPKPAPSITLPEVPSSSSAVEFPLASAPPRLPSIPVLPALDFPSSPSTSSASRPLPSKRFSAVSKLTTSTVSTRVRRFNRSEALAALEGRCRSAPVVPTRPVRVMPLHNDFMSMSDDESDSDVADDEYDNDESMDYITAEIFNPLMEPEDVVLPSPTNFFFQQTSSSLVQRRLSSSPSSRRYRTRRSHTDTTSGTHHKPSTRSRSSRSKSEWFPLKSFIDLHNDRDDDSHSYSNSRSSKSNWSWRSFIEVSNAS